MCYKAQNGEVEKSKRSVVYLAGLEVSREPPVLLLWFREDAEGRVEAFPDPAAGSPWTTALSAGGAVQRRPECTSECIGRVARREMTHTHWYYGSST